MSRGRKLLIAGLVLVVGFVLAWPFRKTTIPGDLESVAKKQTRDVEHLKKERVKRRIQPTNMQPLQFGSPAPHVVAKMTNMRDAGVFRQRKAPAASFDLANHPALATPLTPRLTSPVTPPLPPNAQPTQPAYPPAQVQQTEVQQNHPSDPRLVYSTIDHNRQLDSNEQEETEVRHVVQNSDTLEKLAKRYLGDESRALEIFDLNRDILDNPHLLPIKAELRIPGPLSVD